MDGNEPIFFSNGSTFISGVYNSKYISVVSVHQTTSQEQCCYTVEPPLSGHPLLNGRISNSQNICNTITIKYTSIKRPPPLSGRGHL